MSLDAGGPERPDEPLGSLSFDDLAGPALPAELPFHPHPAEDVPPAVVFLARLRLRPWVTYALLAINLLMGVAVTVDTTFVGNPFSLIEFGAKDRLLIESGEWWRLIAAAFLHQGAFHLLINGYALWVLGGFCEVLYGRSRFLLIYVGSALGSSLASLQFTEQSSVGASGAVFGLMGAALVFGFRHRAEIPALIGKRLRGMLLFWLVVNLILGFLIPVIDNWGHLGGLVSGFALALALGDAAFARRGPALAYRAAAAVAGIGTAAALFLGVENRMHVAYPTLADWASASDHLAAGDPNRALLLLDRARTSARGGEPWLALVLLDRARALEMRGEQGTAAAVVDSVAAEDLDRLRYPWAIEAAERFVGFRRYPEAEKLYRQVLARRRDPSAANNLAWLYLTAEDPTFQRPAAALPYAEKAVRAEPKNPFYLGTLGTAQLQTGRYRPAFENLRKAVELHDPGNEGTDLYLLAMALARLGRGEEARAVLAEAVARFPDDRFRRPAEAAVSRPAVSL